MNQTGPGFSTAGACFVYDKSKTEVKEVNICEDERLVMKNSFILIKHILLASTTTSILTCLQLTRHKALSTDLSFPSLFSICTPHSQNKASVLLPEQHYHRILLKQSCLKKKKKCVEFV